MAKIKKGKKKTFKGTAVDYMGTPNCSFISSESKGEDNKYPQIQVEDQDDLFKPGKRYKITIERLD